MALLLLVDKNHTTRRVVELCFENADFEVVSFDSATPALEYFKRHRPDVLLTNAVLPDSDGYEFCRLIKADPRTADIPVVLLVGALQFFNEKRAREVGIQAHVEKPFQTSFLIRLVTETLKQAKQLARRTFPAAPLLSFPLSFGTGQSYFALDPRARQPAPVWLETEVIVPDLAARLLEAVIGISGDVETAPTN